MGYCQLQYRRLASYWGGEMGYCQLQYHHLASCWGGEVAITPPLGEGCLTSSCSGGVSFQGCVLHT